MDPTNDDLGKKPLSNDPRENLRMENELLHLKIKAELDVDTGKLRHPSPQVENQFLKQVLAFERKTAGAKKQKVYDLIGRPAFKKAGELDNDGMEKALKPLIQLLFKHNIEVLWGDAGDIGVKYRFITEEIFEHEMHDASKDDFTARFDYDRFHPDHKRLMTKVAQGFLSAWFQRGFSENTNLLANRFMLPDKSAPSKKEVLAKLKLVFDAYSFFANEDYKIENITFKIKQGKDEDTGLGHVDGVVTYTAVFENGETTVFDGVFSLFMAYQNERWQIFFFIFPGANVF